MEGNRLAGRVAAVTGASRGLGRAIALALAQEGASVAVAARTVEEYDARTPGTVHETVREIHAAGGSAVAIPCDVALVDDIERLVATVKQEFGPIDLLVNNAAITIPGRPPNSTQFEPRRNEADATGKQRGVHFLDFPVKGFRRHFDVNVFGPYRLMQLVLPDMIARGSGSIINVSAEAARHPPEGPYTHSDRTTGFAYGGSKAALEHLTRAVAFEMAHHGITVNALVPSRPILTPGVIAGGNRYTEDQLESDAEFAEAAVLLAIATPNTITGRIAYSQDIVHPDLGSRGWLGGPL